MADKRYMLLKQTRYFLLLFLGVNLGTLTLFFVWNMAVQQDMHQRGQAAMRHMALSQFKQTVNTMLNTEQRQHVALLQAIRGHSVLETATLLQADALWRVDGQGQLLSRYPDSPNSDVGTEPIFEQAVAATRLANGTLSSKPYTELGLQPKTMTEAGASCLPRHSAMAGDNDRAAVVMNCEAAQLFALYYVPQQMAGDSVSLGQSGPGGGWFILKHLSTDQLQPRGPFMLRVFQGDSTAPEDLRIASLDPFMRQRERIPGTLSADPRPERMSPESNVFPPDGGPRHTPEMMMPQSWQTLTWQNHLGQPVFTTQLGLSIPPFNDRQVAQYSFVWLLVLVTNIVLSFWVAKRLQAQFIHPVQVLSEAVQQVQEGKWNTRLDAKLFKQPQIQFLTEAFNHLVQSLKEKREMQGKFIASLTHDLKTPLLAQERTLELIAEEFEEHRLKAPHQLTQQLIQNNQQLLNMIQHFLEAYHLEQTALLAQPRVVQLKDLLEKEAASFQALLTEHGHQLMFSFDARLNQVSVDPEMLSRMTQNLLMNAIENIPKGSKIELKTELSENNEGWCLHVLDNGSGLPTEMKEDLFQPYVDRGDTHKIGSGLGLYICKTMMDAHGGHITYDRTEDQRTDFCLVFPTHTGPRPNLH